MLLALRQALLQHGSHGGGAATAAAALTALRSLGGASADTANIAAGIATSGGPPPPDGHDFVGHYTPVTKRLWAERLRWRVPEADADADAASSSTAAAGGGGALEPRAPQVTSVTYPFESDPSLVEAYANPWRGVRIGRVLEDLDSLAASVALRHCLAAGRPDPWLVTVSADAIRLKRPLRLDRDITLEGRVVWTGSSSLDIRMALTQAGGLHAPCDASLVAIFSFVLLEGGRPAPRVPPLAPQTPQERAWFAERQAIADARRRQRRRQEEAAGSGGGGHADGGVTTAGLPPAARRHLDELVAAAGLVRDMPALAPPHDILMGATSLQNVFTCHYQQRNLHGRIFGGFLMRRAFELAFATCHLFAGSRPAFESVERVEFRRPVDVGALMRMRSWVLRAEGDRVAVLVEAATLVPARLESTQTNRFTFVFRASPAHGQQQLRRVLPGGAGDLQRLSAHFAQQLLAEGGGGGDSDGGGTV